MRRRPDFLRERLRAGQTAELIRCALTEEQRHLRHALCAADDEDLAAASAHFLVRGCDGFDAAGAIAMQGDRGNVFWNSRPQRDDAGHVRRIGGLGRHNQKITSIDERGIESGALEQRRYDDAPQFDSIEARRSVARFAERRPNSTRQ